jgi:hypothetical protein
VPEALFRRWRNAKSDGTQVLYMFNASTVQVERSPIASGLLTAVRPTRTDVRVDFVEDLSRAWIHSPRRKKYIYTSESGHLETVGLGQRGRNRFTRIYDKAAELHLPSRNWWRVEVESRPGPLGDPLPADLIDHLDISRFDLPSGTNSSTLALAHFIQTVPNARDLLSYSSYRRALKTLEEFKRPIDPSPAEVYGRHINALRAQLDALMSGDPMTT